MKNKFSIKKLLLILSGAGLIISLIAIGLSKVTATQDEAGQPVIGKTEKNGVLVSLLEVSVERDLTDITACIDFPDNGDWLPNAVLEKEDTQIPLYQLALINAEQIETFESNHRCYHFLFPIAADESSKFIITEIQTTLPESLTDQDCRKAQETIQKEYPALEFKCETSQGIRFDIIHQPENMKGENINRLIYEALTKKVEGPWVFDTLK
jgi:hypothetical protein